MKLGNALKLVEKFERQPPTDEIWEKCRKYYHFKYLVSRFYAEGYEIVNSKKINKQIDLMSVRLKNMKHGIF